MNVEVTKLPESRVALKIELTPQEVDGALDRTYKTLVQRVNIPGFRKGKAPRAVLERQVGPEVFLHEATDEAVRWAYRRAVDQENLSPIDEAEIGTGEHDHDSHLAPGEAFQFEATVSVRPDVRLPDYKSLRVERQLTEVTDADVDALVHEIRERNATLEPTVRAAQIGDVVSMNITGRVDGNEVLNNENADFEVRDEEAGEPDPRLPGLSGELVGANRGEIKEVALELPELYREQELAGKTLFLRILVKEIKRKVLPAADDDLARTVSDFETLDELKATLRQNLELEQRIESNTQLVADVVRTAVDRSFVEIPSILIEDELDGMVDDMRTAFERRQLSFETYLETVNKSEDDVRAELREDAIRNVKTSLVLGAVADAEEIEVSSSEINAELEEVFRTAETSDAERRRLRSSAAARSRIRNRLRRRKAISRLAELMAGADEVDPDETETVGDQASPVAEDAAESLAVEVG